MILSFSGIVQIEGDDDNEVNEIPLEEIKNYLLNAVSLDLDVEGQGDLRDDASVVAIELYWGTLQKEC